MKYNRKCDRVRKMLKRTHGQPKFSTARTEADSGPTGVPRITASAKILTLRTEAEFIFTKVKKKLFFSLCV